MAAVAPELAASPVREPRCHNCGAPAPEAYCPRCGQETSIRLPTARQFLKEAAGRYVALDGRLWRTLAALLLHPGYLTREYLGGRRRRYVRPSRLFLVLSLALFAVIRIAVGVPKLDDGFVVLDAGGAGSGDAAEGESATGSAPRSARISVNLEGPRMLFGGLSLTVDEGGDVNVEGSGRIAQALRERLTRFNALPRQERVEQAVLGTLRYGPYAMFVLLPAFAFLLMVVYAGRRRRYPQRPRRYAEHLVYAAHNHAFVFLVATLAVAAAWRPLAAMLALWALGYTLWSMKAVYGGGWLGVVARSWLLALAYLVLFVFVTVALVIAAIVIR